MRIIVLIILFFSSYIGFTQNCDCTKEFKFVNDKVENNLPAYFDQVNITNRNIYNQNLSWCTNLASKAKTERECLGVIMTYLSFFKDNHLRFNFKDKMNPYDNLADTFTVKRLFINEKKIVIKNIDSLYKKKNNSIEGVWQSNDGNLIIAIVANKTLFGDYSGIIIKGNKRFWDEGQIKFEIKKQMNNNYSCLSWSSYRLPFALQATQTNDTLNIDNGTYIFIRYVNPIEKKQLKERFKNERLIFKQLSEQTLYLAIPSFAGEEKTSIDSIIGENLSLLKTKQNLIIDIRYNGGGNTPCLDTLLPLIYTNPVNMGCPQYLGSLDHIKYKEYQRDFLEETKKDKDDVTETIELMKKNIGKFIPCETEIYTSTTTFDNLKNIAVLANEYSASTAEAFLIYCKQSNKTKIYGKNSGGMIAYGSVKNIDLPTLPFHISMAMSKTGYSFEYEYNGVKCDISLDKEQELKWIEQVQKMIEKK